MIVKTYVVHENGTILAVYGTALLQDALHLRNELVRKGAPVQVSSFTGERPSIGQHLPQAVLEPVK